MTGPGRAVAFIPARAGSERVPGKNVRPLRGHPLIAYTIALARRFEFQRIIVSTDSPEIARIASDYGAEVPFLRPSELAGSTSPDIAWILHALDALGQPPDLFAILRPTSPFRRLETLERAFRTLASTPEADSLRAVRKCREHPGKMWLIEGGLMRPYVDQSHLDVAWHARQYQDLPAVYVQTSALEVARTRVVLETRTREGQRVAPFLVDEVEGFAIDHEDDWEQAEAWMATGRVAIAAPPSRSGVPSPSASERCAPRTTA